VGREDFFDSADMHLVFYTTGWLFSVAAGRPCLDRRGADLGPDGLGFDG
jgi:hypothetical protein